MGQNYQAQKRVEHVAIACGPDLIKPTPNSPPAPFITYAEFNISTGVADQGSGNQYPLFTSLSKVPTCKGGPPGGQGVKSGTWNGEFKPTEWSAGVKVDGGWQVYHGHQGTINKGNAPAKVTITVAPGAPSSPCIAALQVQFERLKGKAAAEFGADKWGFVKGMGQGAWDNVKGYGEAAGSVWDSVAGGASALWNDPWGSLKAAGSAVSSAVQSAGNAVASVVDLGKSIYNGDPSLDDMLDGMEDLVNELGPEAACALAKMLEDINNQPTGVASSIGALGSEVALQVGMALVSGGAGNAAAAAAKGTKLAKMGGKGLKLADGIGDKLRGMGLKGDESLSDIFKKLKARRAKHSAKPDRDPPKTSAKPKPAENPDKPPNKDNHNKGDADGKPDKDCPLCPAAGKPVNPVQGCKVLSGDDDLDFSLPGTVPLTWQRSYASNSAELGWWGQGWASPFELCLEEREQGQVLDFIDTFGRRISFPRVARGRQFYSRYEHITLARRMDGQYSIISGDGSSVEFGHRHGRRHHCTALLDANGQGHRLEYSSGQSLPAYLLASGGQVLALRFGPSGQYHGQTAQRLQVVELLNGLATPLTPDVQRPYAADDSVAIRLDKLGHHASRNGQSLEQLLGRNTLVRYDYSADGDLLAVHTPDASSAISGGALEVRRRFAWRNHLMVMHSLPAGLQAHYDYDRLDPTGRVLHHWQDIAHGASKVQRHWYFEYTASHTVVTEHAGPGAERGNGQHQRRTLYHFDSEQHWTGITEPTGAHTRFELDQWGNVKAIHNPDGGATQYVLDGQGRPLLTTNPAGEKTTVLWHSQLALPNEIINPLGASVAMGYDPRGNLIAQTDPLGHTTRFERNAQGLVSRITDAKGGIKHLSYDPWGQLLSHTDCSGQTTRFEYDALGHMASMTDALGHTTHYQHDARGNLLSVRHPGGGQERYQYDAEGRLTAHTDTAGHTTHWELAADGLPIKRRNALGHELGYEYDHWRRLVCLRNENKTPYRFAYDSADRLTAQWSFDALLTEFAYSPGGQLLQVKEYGQIEAQDGVPHPAQRGRAEHLIETRFERDAVGRLLAKHIKGRGQPLQRTRFVYDVAGQLTRASNAYSVVELAYDAAGQLSQESLQAPGLAPKALWPRGNGTPGGREHVLRHAYDALGNRISTTLPDGRVLNTLHYGSGHVHQINIDGQLISDFERDALHRERSRSQGALQSLTQYDALGRTSAQQVRWAAQAPAIQAPEVGGSAAPAGAKLGLGSRIQRHYHYDRAGQLSQIADWQGSLSYRYDPLGQLLSANEERFAFDPAHNLLPANAEPSSSSQGRLPNNRLEVFEDKRYDYDAHGRMVHKRSGSGGHHRTELHWDAEHQLQCSLTHKAGRVTELHYAYDPFGRRIAKYQADSQGRPQAQGSHWYVWDGNRLLQELSPQSQGRLRTDTYVYEPESFVPLAQLQSWERLTPKIKPVDPADLGHAVAAQLPHPTEALIVGDTHWREPGTGRTLPLPTALNAQGRPYASQATAANDDEAAEGGVRILYYHCDQIGTPRELTRPTGEITWQATYKAWGNTQTVQWEVAQGAASAAQGQTTIDVEHDRVDRSGQQPLRFQGQYFDEETGLHYNRFRYYDPDCGRFISHDPIGLDGGENTFGYVPNPSGWVDILGLISNSQLLGKAITGKSKWSGRQAHHLIPSEVFDKNSKSGKMLQSLQSCKLFNLNGKGNGIMLPEEPGRGTTRSKHSGYHAGYNRAMEEILEEIANTTPCAKDQARKIQRLQSKAHEALRAGKAGLYKPTTKSDWLNLLK